MDELKKMTISFLNKLPYIRTLVKLLKQYEEVTAYPPGHYYSPIPDVKELEGISSLFTKKRPEGILLNEAYQLEILTKFEQFYKEFPYTSQPSKKYRYYVPTSFFTYTDAVVLYAMVRLFRPKQVVEIGSGYSSALIMDINQYYFNSNQVLTFIDPNFKRLENLMKPEDRFTCNLIKLKVQEVDLVYFTTLSENDLLFIDSSHVSKVGSDLNYILFTILPVLKKGVIIHFHDLYYPFEYTPELVFAEKLAWNEAYLLKAFLMYNPLFEIVYFSDFMAEENAGLVTEKMPNCITDKGASLYIRKIKE